MSDKKIINTGNTGNIQNVQAENITKSSISQNNSSDIKDLFKKLREEVNKISDPDLKDEVETRVDLLEMQINNPDKAKLQRLKKWFKKHENTIINTVAIIANKIIQHLMGSWDYFLLLLVGVFERGWDYVCFLIAWS